MPRTVQRASRFVLVATLLVSTAAAQARQNTTRRAAAPGAVREARWLNPRPASRLEAAALLSPGPATRFLSTNGPNAADMPREVAFAPDGASALVVHRDTDNLVFFDLATRTATDVVALGDFPVDIAVTADGTKAVVPNVFSNTVSVVDVATRTKLADVAISGLQPFAVATTPDSMRAVVAVIDNGGSSSFSVVNLTTLTEELSFPTTGQGAVGFFFSPEAGISGNLFTAFALSPDGASLVLPDAANDVVTIYERATGAVRATLPTAAFPAGVDISSDSQVAVVSHDGSNQRVSVIDLTTDTLTASHATGINLQDRRIRITPDKSHALCAVSNAIIFVNLATGAVPTQITTGIVGDIEFSFDGQLAFVSNFNSRVIDLASRTLLATLPLAPSYEAAVSPVTLRAVALNNRFREDVHVYTITGATAAVEGRGISGPAGEADATRTLALSGDGRVAVAANNTSRTASVIDLEAELVRATIPTGDRSLGVAVSADGTTAVVANGDDDTVSVLDLTTDTRVAQLDVSSRPGEVAIAPDGAMAYVTTIAGTDRVHFIQLAGAASTVVGSLATGQMGSANGYAYSALSGIGLSADGSVLAVCVSFDDQLMLIDTATQTEFARVSVGDFPVRVAFHPSGTRAWVLNAFGDSVSVVDIAGAASTTVATVGGIDFPSVVLATETHAYVANSGSPSAVFVLDAVTNGLVQTVGLPTRVRGGWYAPKNSMLYLGGTADAGGRLHRLSAGGPATALLNTVELSSGPCELVFSQSTHKAVLAQPIPDGVDIVDFAPRDARPVEHP